MKRVVIGVIGQESDRRDFCWYFQGHMLRGQCAWLRGKPYLFGESWIEDVTDELAVLWSDPGLRVVLVEIMEQDQADFVRCNDGLLVRVERSEKRGWWRRFMDAIGQSWTNTDGARMPVDYAVVNNGVARFNYGVWECVRWVAGGAVKREEVVG